jgi:hypothetical protein
MSDPRFEIGTQFSETDILKIEQALRRHLSQDYREFVKVYGGAFVGGTIDGSDELSILNFFDASNDRGVSAVLSRYEDLKEDGILPFARDELGNIYVQNVDDEIFFINYYGGCTSVRRVADNFSEFIARIVVADQ